MSQHTPGPIEVEFDGKFTVTYRVGDQESAFRVLPEMGRLIAAAPEMYDLVAYVASHGCPHPETPGGCHYCAARALIRKAKGEA